MRRATAAAVLVVLAIGTWSGVAGAQTTPPTTAAGDGFGDPNRCAAPDPADNRTPADLVGGQPNFAGPSGIVPPDVAAGKDNEDEGGGCGSLLESLAPGEQIGPHPDDNYDIGYSAGGKLCPCFSRRLFGPVTDAAFGINVWLVRVGTGIIWKVGDLDLATKFASAAQRAADAYQTRVIGPLDLGHSFLFLAAAWATWLAFTGKAQRGFAELGVSLLIGALATTVLANPDRWLIDAMKTTSQMGYSVAAASVGQDPETASTSSSVTRPMAEALHKAFVEDTWERLNWGPAYPSKPECRDVAEKALASGPWGASAKPRDAMKKAGCYSEARFNADPSRSRFFAAALLAVGGMLVMVFLALMALTALSMQLLAVGLVAVAPFAFVIGTLPGRGRALFWRWWGSAASTMLALLVVTVLLSWVLVGVTTTLEVSAGVGLLMQFLVVDVIVVLGLVKRKHVLKGTQKAAHNFAQRMASAQPGGGGGARRSVSWRTAEAGLVGAGIGAAAERTWQYGQQAGRAWDRHERRSIQRTARATMGERQRENGASPMERAFRDPAPAESPRDWEPQWNRDHPQVDDPLAPTDAYKPEPVPV